MDENEHTILSYQPQTNGQQDAGTVRVRWSMGSQKKVQSFATAFRIGRGNDCEVVLKDPLVSRYHSEVFPRNGNWYVRDLGSRHGTFVNGAQIHQAPLLGHANLEFRIGGPVVQVRVDLPQQESLTQISEHYFGGSQEGEQGEHTKMVRQAFMRLSKRQSRRYWVALSSVGLLLLAALAVVIYQQHKLQKTKELAVGIFYSMHEARLQIAQIQSLIESTGETQHLEAIGARREKIRQMEKQYQQILVEVGLDQENLSQEERLIYRIARLFGECELNMPTGFVDEVKAYIGKWKTTGRLRRAILRAETNNYPETVYREMVKRNLPPQFMYLALQESDFKPEAIGIRTRFGIAKGYWQFIPDTALRYGLKVGPLVELRRYDSRDQRFDFAASSAAAARYIRDIYNTDAQASGLLVLASYNWGPGNVRRLIRKMPENPRERNFWKLLERHRIPKQTHDFVFYIFSAAVIGEDPALFGFKFKNPLEGLDEKLQQSVDSKAP